MTNKIKDYIYDKTVRQQLFSMSNIENILRKIKSPIYFIDFHDKVYHGLQIRIAREVKEERVRYDKSLIGVLYMESR